MAEKPEKRYNYYQKKPKLWTPASLDKAVSEVQGGATIRSAAKKYHISEFTVRKELHKKTGAGAQEYWEGVLGRGYQGRSKVLSPEQEEDIAALVRAFARARMGLRKSEIGEVIQTYCQAHDIEQWAENPPSKKFIIQFCERQKLTLRKEAMFSISREEATANPFVILDFYERLEGCLQQLRDAGVAEADLPTHVYNCDETGFPYDPSPVRVVGGSGENRPGTRAGEGKKNTTVMACASAAGNYHPPMVIFNLINRPPESTLDGCMPGMRMEVSKKGWMTKDIFVEWFSDFCGKVPERPLLLLLDGASTHVSVAVLEKAIEQNVILLKFPPHTTDVLQPLDVVPFASLKTQWSDKLRKFVQEQSRPSQPSRHDFSLFLSELWDDHFSADTLKKAFAKCGILPLIPGKYPHQRFDEKLLVKYRKWEAAGKQPMTDEEYETFVTALSPKKGDPPGDGDSRTPSPEPDLYEPRDEPGPSSSGSKGGRPRPPRPRSVSRPLSVDVDMVPPKPEAEPIPGYPKPHPDYVAKYQLAWVAVWAPSDEIPDIHIPKDLTRSQLTPEEKTQHATKMILSHRFGDTPKHTRKRKPAEVITTPEFLAAKKAKEQKAQARKSVQEANAAKKAAKAPKQSKPAAKNPPEGTRKKPQKLESGSDSSGEDNYSVHDSSEDGIDYPPKQEYELRSHLSLLWSSLKPPVAEDALKGKWYALIYYRDEGRKNPVLMFGKFLNRFLSDDADEGGVPTGFRFECLEPTRMPGNVYKAPAEPDIDQFLPWDVIDGPLSVTAMKDRRYKVPSCDDVNDVYAMSKEFDRKDLILRKGLAAETAKIIPALPGDVE